MTRKLIFHAGLPKTGTTAVQTACHAARDTLLQADGLLYPSLAANHTTAICTLFLSDPAQHIINRLKGIQSGARLQAAQTHFRESLLSDLTRDDWTSVLISSEGASNRFLTRQELTNLKLWFSRFCDTFSIVFYLRNPVDYATSMTQQLLKEGALLSDLIADPPLPDWYGKIGAAIDVFGRENVHIRSFEQATAGNDDLIGDFCDHLGLSPASRNALSTQARHRNESLSLEAALMLNQINIHRPFFNETGRSLARTGLETTVLQGIPGRRFTLPAEVQKACHNATRQDVTWLNRTFATDLYTAPFSHSGNSMADTGLSDETLAAIALHISDSLSGSASLKACLDASEAMAQGNQKQARACLKRAEALDPNSPYIANIRAILDQKD